MTTPSRPAQHSALASRLDFGLLATLALCLFTLWPLLYRPGLPNGNDTLYHIYRVAEMDRAWAHGVLAPTWAEAFYTGYGSPVFHYYASLSYYLSSLLMRLFGLDPVNVLRLFTALCMLLAGGGMYLFMRDQLNKLAGIIAALVYVYSPYFVFTEPYARGVYPELLALALFPLLMWRYSRLLNRASPLNLLLAAFLSAALILSHNLMALALTALLLAWIIWQGLINLERYRRALTALAALGLGIGLTAYFWLPVILEQGAVRLGNLTAVAQLDYRNFFVPLHELLAFSPRVDAGAINGLYSQFNLGVAQWGLALAGVVGVIILHYRSTVGARHVSPLQVPNIRRMLFWLLAALVCIAIILPQADFLWQAAAPLAFFQFPWRFLGPALFCLAVLAGHNAHWIERLPQRLGAIVTTLILIAIITLALPTLYIDEWEHFSVDSSVAGYHAVEALGLQRGTTFSDEYLPRTVIAQPSPNAALMADYADGYPMDKANRAALPAGVELDLLHHGPQSDSWRVNAPDAFTLEVLTYDFPGWQAYVDGAAVEVRASDPHGLINFEVPAGDHRIDLRLGATSPRRVGQALTLVSSLLLLAGMLYLRRPTDTNLSATPLPAALRWGIILAGLLQTLLLVLLMRQGIMWLESPPGTAQVAQDQTVYDFGDQIQLLGYDLNRREFRPGDQLELALYWYAREPVDYGYASFVHISQGGPPFAQADKQNPAGRPTREWTPDGYIYDSYLIDLPPDMPPGEYQLVAGLYTCDTLPPGECGNGDRLLVRNADGDSLGDFLPLATITVH